MNKERGDLGRDGEEMSTPTMATMGLHGLPKGAMRPVSGVAGYRPVDGTRPSPAEHVQFARYPSPGEEEEEGEEKEKEKPWNERTQRDPEPIKADELWIPTPLRPWYWIPFVIVLVLGAIGLEVALRFSDKNQGWNVKSNFSAEQGIMHFVYTLPPVAVAMIVVALWTWTDVEIRKMQPYVDLAQGDAPPQRSVLLDYTRLNNYVVGLHALRNRHFIVALASAMTLLALAFQPLAAAIFTVRSTWVQIPDQVVHNLAVLGLNQNPEFQNLTVFLTAAGYASAATLYGLGDPSFVHEGYTIGEIELPTNIASNGTVVANTTAVISDPGCQPAQSITQEPVYGNPSNSSDVTGWVNTATFNDCTYNWNVSKDATYLFGTDLCNNSSGVPDQFSSVVFWFFSYSPPGSHSASVTYCSPTISLWDVTASIDIISSNLTSVTSLGPFNAATSNFSASSGNITGAPLNGRAYNGVRFNLTGETATDATVLARQNATQTTLPAAVFQAAVNSDAGLDGTFENDGFVGLTSKVYSTYLSLIAKSVYFLPASEAIYVQVKTFKDRLWLSAVAVHLTVAALLVLALMTTIIQLLHRHERRNLRLAHRPGTIASAVVIGAKTGLGELLAGRHRTDDIIQALRDKRFRIDPQTMKIVMEGDEGYETAHSPDPKKSVFAYLGGGAGGLTSRMSKRFSRGSANPARK